MSETNPTEKHPLQIVLERTDYGVRSISGRCMDGEECLGVEIPAGGTAGLFADVLVALVEGFRPGSRRGEVLPVMSDRVAEAFRGMRTDSLGKRTIAYFPGVPFVKGSRDEWPEDYRRGMEEEDREIEKEARRGR